MNDSRIEYEKRRIVSRAEKYGGYLELEIESPMISRKALPGNFVMIRGWEGDSPILPRPFDILECSPERNSFKLIIKITGKGTGLLWELQSGDRITILGPLGRGIDIPDKTSTGKKVKDIGLLARGVGAAALVLLAEQARSKGIGVHTFLTASEKEKLVCHDYLGKYSDTLITGWDKTEKNRGSDGRDLLKKYLEKNRIDLLYTCGSRRFGRFVQELENRGELDGFLFMESRMACGIGDCHGCTVTTSDDEYILVCQEGPVFPASMIKL